MGPDMPPAKSCLTYAAPFAFLAGIAHLAWLAGLHWHAPAEEIRSLWLAGDIWTRGGDPYTTYEAAPGDAYVTQTFQSGPNWFPIAALFSLASPETAMRVWLGAAAALLLGASAFNVLAFRKMAAQSALFGQTAFVRELKRLPPVVQFLLHAGFVTTMAAAGQGLIADPGAVIAYAGASLLLYGVAAKHDLSGAAGTALLLLTPGVGLIVAAGLWLGAYGRRAFVLGAIFAFLMAVPVLAVTPGVDIAATLITGAGERVEIASPVANAATLGLSALLGAGGAPGLGPAFYFLLALAAVSAFGLIGRKRPRALKPVDNFMIATATALAIAPLGHAYLLLTGLFLFYATALRPPLGAALLAAAFFIWRAGDLPGADIAGEAVYASAGTAALFATLLGAAFFSPAPERRRKPATPLGDNVVLWSNILKNRRSA